jgi:hypothetical protein
MRLCDLYDETRVAPPAKRFVCRHVDPSFSFRARDGDGEICFTGCAVDVRVSGDKKTFFDWRTEGLDYRRVGLRSRQSVFVDVGRFHRAEHDQRDRANKSGQQYQHAEAAERHEPFPVSLPPVRSCLCSEGRRILLHGVFLLQPRSFLQSFLVPCALFQA